MAAMMNTSCLVAWMLAFVEVDLPVETSSVVAVAIVVVVTVVDT